MMLWLWVVLAFSLGTMVGVVLMAALAAVGFDDAYEAGYRAGAKFPSYYD